MRDPQTRTVPFRIFIACMAAMIFCARSAIAASPDEVQNTIDKAVAYIYAHQTWGNWEHARKLKTPDSPAQSRIGGMTVSAVYALLSAGERPDNPKLKDAIDYLKNTEFVGVYSLGMRCMIWRMLLPDDEVKADLRRDGELLMKKIALKNGLYAPSTDDPSHYPDHSFSQFGPLGVWAAAQEGMEVPTSYWQTVDSGWRVFQSANGSWNYGPNPADKSVLLPMTAAGLATLFMAQDQLSMGSAPACKGNLTDPQIEAGFHWLGQHFREVFKSHYQYYSMYQIEELASVSGRKYFGNTDWYAQVADFLVRTQESDGSWNNTVPDTAFAVLFLTHGRAPVSMNKLQYFTADDHPSEGNWNQRSRDLVNLNHWVSKQVELDKLLNWQVVNLAAPAADLHDASVLYIAGDKALNLSDADKQKLKLYIEQGGMVLFNADCGSSDFSDSVKQLANQLFPQIGEFRELPADHCMLNHEQFLASDWADPPTILGLSNGVRELMILLPKADPSRAWQAQMTSSKEPLFEFGADLLLYASDKQNIREKGDSYIVEPSSRIKATRTLKVGRIKYDGMWDPEPGGWRRLAAVVHNRDQLDLDVEPVNLSQNVDLTVYKILDLTGSGHVALDVNAWVELHSFVQSGGTLIIDAAGGSQTFNDDVKTQLQAAFFDDANQLDTPLRPGHVLYTDIGSKIDQVSYRNFARHVLEDNLDIPRIRGIKVGDHIGVFYSAEDISAGLVGEPVDGIIGYSPDSATALMEHMILYAESGGRPNSGTGGDSAQPNGN